MLNSADNLLALSKTKTNKYVMATAKKECFTNEPERQLTFADNLLHSRSYLRIVYIYIIT